MTVDSLTYLGESLFGQRATARELIARLDEAEIDRAVVCPVKPRGYHFGPANDEIAETVRAHSDRLTGFARVDPHLGEEACIELDRALGELGLRGVFLHPWEETFRISASFVDPVVETARRHGVPVMIAAGYPWLSEGLQVGDLAGRFPDVTFVATNGVQINISGLGQVDAELALAQNANLFMQTAGVYREDFIEGIVERLGADRVLFSSAFPRMDPRLEVLRVRWSHMSEAAKEQVLGGNARRLGLA